MECVYCGRGSPSIISHYLIFSTFMPCPLLNLAEPRVSPKNRALNMIFMLALTLK